MTTKELLEKIGTSDFSDQAKQDIHATVGDESVITTELMESILAIIQNEIEADLAGIPLDTAEVQKLEAKLNETLAEIEHEAEQNVEITERELRELSDLAQKVDVLERLNS